MAQVDTFFQQRDKKRWLTDRFAGSVIHLGGISVLIALVLLVFYLIVVTAPIFSSATLTLKNEYPLSASAASDKTEALGVADNGKMSFRFTRDGQLIFTSLDPGASLTTPHAVLTKKIIDNPASFKAADPSSGWYAYADEQGKVLAVKPKFITSDMSTEHWAVPSVDFFPVNPITLDPDGEKVIQFDFTILTNSAVFVGLNNEGKWRAVSYTKPKVFGQNNDEEGWKVSRLLMPDIAPNAKDFVLTPDGKTLYVLYSHSIHVLKMSSEGFALREEVPLFLSANNKSNEAIEGSHLNLLSGAYSILVTQSNGKVSQWFDVLKDGERHFTKIRDFDAGRGNKVSFLLPDFYSKSFFIFDHSGNVDNFYTTSEDHVLSKKIGETSPVTAATSSNENFLMVAYQDKLSLFTINNPHPDISFTSLWKKVWYEGYPEPEFIWQSTSASNDFEAKFSLVPIAFGTLKSALFAMIFAVPISICGAIYTAYFMTARMRRYVKPTIELMEALPTVIIGFLAGLWLAPIVELNLLNTILFIVFLPCIIFLSALFWHGLRKFLRLKERQGWAALFLIPVIAGFAVLVFSYGHYIEHWLFGGDVRLFMSSIGVGFDQRNALIVGFAMGFAVIPTIFTIAEDAIFSVPKHLSDGASALGATPWQCLTTVVLVTASPGIFSAVMMGLARAVGETMIVLMATGNTPVMDWNIFEGMRTLSANIAIEMPESEVGSSHFRLLFLTAFLLFAFTFVVNSIAELIRQRLRNKYSAL